MNIKIGKRSVLIIVDVQKDFCQGGTLPVPRGNDVVPVLNRYIRKFEEAGAQIYATRDWHPSNHVSFASQGGPWPSHCVQNTEGAEFHRDLVLSKDTIIISKANSLKETYSGFDETNLEADLK